MVLPNPPSNTTPIPNNPFYSVESTYFQGPYYPALVTPTSGIQVNTNGTISVTGGGGGGGTVTAVSAVSPLSVINSTTTPVISVSASSTTAVGVVRLFDGTNSTSTSEALTANQGYILQQQINSLTVSSNLTLAGTISAVTGLLLTVTSDGTSQGFTVGFPLPPASSGNNSYFVIITTPGTMTPPGGSATVCNQGDWWLSDGTSWSIIDNAPAIPVASLTTQGIVQLYDGVNSTSITCAATPNSIKTAYDVAAAAMPVAGGTFSGPVTFGSSALFNGATVYCSTNTFCGPTAFCCPSTFGATSTFCCPVTFCCTPILPAGVALGCAACVTYNNSTSGLTATNVQTAIDQVKALTASAIPCSCVTDKGALITGTGAAAPVALAVGTNGQYLAANSTCANGLNWVTPTSGTVTSVSAGTGLTGGTITSSGVLALDFSCIVAASILTAKGSIIAASGLSAPAALAVGSNGQILTVNSLCSSGLAWVTPTSGTLTSVTAGTGLTGGTITSTGTIALDTACVLSPALLTAKGAIISASAASTPSTINVGSNGQVLTACSTCTGGLTWSTQSVSAATPSVAGTVFGCTSLLPSGNTSIGYQTLFFLTSGCLNTASGIYSLNSNTTGSRNTATGSCALICSVSGIYNTATGASSLFSNTTGLCNTATGYEALYSAISGCGNTGVGFGAVRSVTSGCLNAAVGACALYNVTTGSCNVGLGPWVQVASGTGSCQLAIGFSSADNWLTGRSDKSIQPGAGLRDNTGALGTSGQVLTSTGTGIAWGAVCSGTLTSITAGTGLNGGTITTSGTITLNTACVIPPTIVTAKGSLIAAAGVSTPVELTVGTNGQVLSACSTCSNGLTWVTPTNGTVTAVTGTLPISVTAGNTPVVSIAAASTTATGSVQLYDNTNSTSTALALTAAQGKNLQDQINALEVTSNLTLAGTFNATTGLMLTVTSAGTAAGFTVGANLIAAAAGNTDYFVIVTTGGSYSPPGGGGPYTASQGDWFLSTGTAWSFLNVGPEANYASTTTAGVVCLSTNALAQTGTDTLTALTPAAGASAYVFKSCYTAKGTILGGSAASTPTALSVGTDGQRLTACAACATGLAWVTPTSGTVTSVATGTGLTGGPVTSTGTISLANTAVTAGSYTYANITVDAQGRITAATSGASPTGGTVTSVATGTGLTGGPVTSTGTISLANTAVTPGTYTNATVTVDAQGRLTSAASGTPAVINYTATKSITSGTPVNLLTWPSGSGFRGGRLWITAYSASLDDWTTAEAIVSASTSGDTSVIIYWAFGIGTITIDTTGGATKFVLNPTSTSASVAISYQYMVGYGPQPTLL